MHRRQFLGTLAAVAGAAVLFGRPRRSRASGVRPSPGQPIGPEVQALFGELRAGSRVRDYEIVAIHEVAFGAIPVVMRGPDGERFQVDVLKRGAVAGVGNTRSLSVFLFNGGDGQRRSDQVHGLGAMALAEALLANEAAGVRPPSSLLTLEERIARHPRARFNMLLT